MDIACYMPLKPLGTLKLRIKHIQSVHALKCSIFKEAIDNSDVYRAFLADIKDNLQYSNAAQNQWKKY